MEIIKWDEKAHSGYKPLVAAALMQYISDDEKKKAAMISYGDLGKMLAENHGRSRHGSSTDSCGIESSARGVQIYLYDLSIEIDMTWNKAAKLIHEQAVSGVSAGGVSEEQITEVSALVSCEPGDDDDYNADYNDDSESGDEVTDISPEVAEALRCHSEIITGAELAQQGLYRMAAGFKRMRDRKLYKALGYSSFEGYCEKETGLKKVQVYAYIKIVEKLPAEFVHSSERIGVKKLELLATLSEEQRAEVAQNVDLESTTVRELKARIDELTGAVQHSTANAERLNKEIADIQTKLDDRNEQFIQNVRELARVRKVKDEIAAEVGRLKGVIEENGIKQRSLEKELEAAKSGEVVLTDEQIEDIAGESVLVSDLRDRIEQLDIEKQAEEQRYEELQGQMNALDEAYRRENERLKEQVDRISAEKTGLETELKEASRTVTVPDTSEVEFEVKYRTALDSIRMLCKFTRAMDNDDMRERVKTLADIIRTSV